MKRKGAHCDLCQRQAVYKTKPGASVIMKLCHEHYRRVPAGLKPAFVRLK